MAIDLLNQNISGAFVPTTFILDVAKIQEVNVNSEEFKELLVRLYQNLNRMSLVLNVKESAYYALNQFVPGQLFFPDTTAGSLVQQNYRSTTRLVINFGALPSSGVKPVAHNININSAVTFTRIYATASDTTGFNYIPIPSVNATIAVDATHVTITTTANLSNYNITYVIVEFLTS